MANSLELQLATPVGSLDAYLEAVHRVPMLTAEEERELAERYRRDNDLEAARRLVLSHLRFVVRLARGYLRYGLPLADLIQEGTIGLMKAVKRFDPRIGVRLVSFAVHWIRAEIHEYILRHWRVVKIATTKAQRKLFFNLRKARKRLGWLGSEDVEYVARELGVPPGEVREMERRMAARDASLEAGAPEDEDRQGGTVTLEDTRFEPERLLADRQAEELRTLALERSLRGLDPRSRDILTRRWLVEDEEKATLQSLAERYSVSAERIRQIEKNALAKLRSSLGAAKLLPAPD